MNETIYEASVREMQEEAEYENQAMRALTALETNNPGIIAYWVQRHNAKREAIIELAAEDEEDNPEPCDPEIYTCYNCPVVGACVFAFDDYNLNGSCLAQK